MKKSLILLQVLLLTSLASQAQDTKFRLGLRLAPSIATSRVLDKDEKDGADFKSNGSGIRFSAGLNGDFYFGKNYAFMTGLWYTVKRAGLKEGNTNIKVVYNAQYLQIPVALKLYTNEIAVDTKLYFILGGTLGAKIAEKRKELDGVTSDMVTKEGDAFSIFDGGLLLGAGAEYQMGENTILFGGLTYNRGLTNAMSKKGLYDSEEKSSNTYTINNNLLGLEVGIKF